MSKPVLLLLWMARRILFLFWFLMLCGTLSGTTDTALLVVLTIILVVIEGVLRVNGVSPD